jgi:hypothetical protein
MAMSVTTTTKMTTTTNITMAMTMITITGMMATITIVTIITTAVMTKRKKMLILVRMGVLSSLAAQMAIAPALGLPDLRGQHAMRGMVVTLRSQVLQG